MKDLGPWCICGPRPRLEVTYITYISIKSAEASQKASWILLTFISRDITTLLVLYNALVRLIVEYCCPLWSPYMICDIIKIEGIQRSFTCKIEGLESMNYWERLKHLYLYSFQRRREYRKVLHNPDPIDIQQHYSK